MTLFALEQWIINATIQQWHHFYFCFSPTFFRVSKPNPKQRLVLAQFHKKRCTQLIWKSRTCVAFPLCHGSLHSPIASIFYFFWADSEAQCNWFNKGLIVQDRKLCSGTKKKHPACHNVIVGGARTEINRSEVFQRSVDIICEELLVREVQKPQKYLWPLTPFS